MKHLLTIFFLSLILGGCVSVPKPTPAQIEAGVTEPPPDDYEQQIKEFWSVRLIDPTAPLYTFAKPTKSYTTRYGDIVTFGWEVRHTVNSKNRFGGYVGAKRYLAFLRNGRLMHILEEGPYGFNLVDTAP